MNERVRLLDALRGFAVFGILLNNILVFSGYFLLPPERIVELGHPTLDHLTHWLGTFLVEGKFYSLFSFLFGLGFAVQMQRAAQRETPFVPLFKRRLSVLLGIGLAHALFLWFGDILSIYAGIGFLLPYFRHCSDKTILRWAAGLLVTPIAIYSLMVVLRLPDPYAALEAFVDPTGEKILNSFTNGTYPQIFVANLHGLTFRYVELLYTSRIPKVLAMFLLGFYSGRRELFSLAETHLPMIRRVCGWGVVLGLVGNAALAQLMEMGVESPPSPLGILQTAAYALGVPSLCLFYLCAISLLWQRPLWRVRLSVLAPVGQMALSNYLLQTLLCVTIFYGYGFGYFGSVGATSSTGLAVLIFALQIGMSHWWLKRFQYGPLEWLWRSLTYGQRQPLLKTNWQALKTGKGPSNEEQG